ncbi:MAG: hypothetical protein KY460_05765 [Actinobacteria bacterium]|nr:hypothetical protein [Actinomycetota bacterium]
MALPDRTPTAATLTLVVVLLAVAACSGSASSTPAPTPSATATHPTAASATAPSAPPPAGLSASLVQYRRDQPRRFVEVKLDNRTDTTLDVTLLGVTLPGFESPQDIRRTTRLEPDRRVDLPVALGNVVCARDPVGTASATVDVARDSGTSVRTTLPVDDGGLLDRLRDFECAIAQAVEVVEIELSPTWRQRGSGAELTVEGKATIRSRSPAVPVEVTAVNGNLLFAVEPETIDPRPPVTVDAQRPEARVTFAAIPARCDGHAIAEARRLTTFAFLVAVDGAQPVPLRRAPAEDGYQTLISALRERCGIS